MIDIKFVYMKRKRCSSFHFLFNQNMNGYENIKYLDLSNILSNTFIIAPFLFFQPWINLTFECIFKFLFLIINKEMLNSVPVTKETIYFHIDLQEDSVSFSQKNLDYLYNNSKEGFIRKAKISKTKSYLTVDKFIDPSFRIEQNNNFRLMRLYDLYGRQLDLFPQNTSQSSYIDQQNIYCSFLGQSGVASYDYLRTLFISQKVNKQGYYEYFVKRDGEYYLQSCDDYIPVDKMTRKPLWGLNINYPWQVILLKAWIKQCGSMDNLFRAQPFRFLQAFGLPYSISENSQNSQKPNEQQNKSVNKINKQVFIIARTVNSNLVKDLGLVPNSASYIIKRFNKSSEQQGLFKVYSSLPCHWVGQYSPVNTNSQLNEIYKQEMKLDLERNLLMTQQQVMKCFNKYYVTPTDMNYIQNLRTQDCLNLQAKGKPLWIKFDIKSAGLLAMSIQLPKIRNQGNRYPQIRYFMSKYNTEQQKSKSHIRQDIPSSQLIDNLYVESTCDKWDCFRIDFVQGYHNAASFFTRVVNGHYVLFIDVEYVGMMNLRIDSHVEMTCPQRFQPSVQLQKQIFDSTFFSISQETGVQASLSQESFDQSISLNNDFQELGFGSICIKTLSKAKQKVAMRVYPEKLRQAGLQLVSHYGEMQEDENRQKNILLVSSSGKPEIIVLQRIDNRKKSQIGQIFPPPGTIQFFKITPKPLPMVIQKKI